MLQISQLHYHACLIQRSLKGHGVAFHCGSPVIQADLSANKVLIEYILGLRAALGGADSDIDTAELDQEHGPVDAEMNLTQSIEAVAKIQPAARRVLRYESGDDSKIPFHGVPEGPGSWQQFFADCQVAKLVSPRMAVVSAYDHENQRVRLGRFQLCYKVKDSWHCRCPAFAVRKSCVCVRAAAHLEQTEKPMFAAEQAVIEIEPGALWAVQGNGVLFEPVYRQLDATVCQDRCLVDRLLCRRCGAAQRIAND